MSSDADGRGGREGGAEAEKGEGDRGSADGGKGRAGDAGAGKGAARREIEAGARRRSLPAARPSSGHLSARAAWVDALAAPLAPLPLMAAAAAAVAALAPLRRNALRLLARVLRPRVQRIARTDEAGWQGICRSAFDERRSRPGARASSHRAPSCVHCSRAGALASPRRTPSCEPSRA